MKLTASLLVAFFSIWILNSCEEEESTIEYPKEGQYGENILDGSNLDHHPGSASLCAILEEDEQLEVKIIGDPWWFDFVQVSPFWQVSEWNEQEKSRVFKSIMTGTIDAEIILVAGVEMTLRVYENGDPQPTWSKSFKVKNSSSINIENTP